MSAMVEPSQPSGRLPAALGVASVALLAAAFRWAHHWGVTADLIVAAWALSTVSGLVLSLRATDGPGRRAALFGLALAGVSVAALVITGIAMVPAPIRPAPAAAVERIPGRRRRPAKLPLKTRSENAEYTATIPARAWEAGKARWYTGAVSLPDRTVRPEALARMI